MDSADGQASGTILEIIDSLSSRLADQWIGFIFSFGGT